MTEVRWELPENWEWAPAGEIARIVGGGTPSSKVEENFAKVGIPWITPADLTGYKDAQISRGRRDLSEIGFASCGAQMLPPGSVLFSSRAPIGYCVIASNEVSTNQGFKSLVLDGGISPEYVRYYLISAKDYAESKASGTTFMELSGKRVAELAVPVAPLPEQRRIVAKVDGLTARTARARKELDRIPTLIARYKQRLLALAFSGELTGGTENWRTGNIGDLADTQLGKMLDKAKNRGEPTKYLRNINVRWYDFKLDDVLEMPMSDAERLKFSIENGDILTCEGGEPGRSAIWNRGASDLAFQKALIRIRPKLEKLNPAYLVHYLKYLADAQELERYFTGSTIKHLPQRALQSVELPVPPIEEQAEIVRHIESAFGWLDRMAADHAAAARLLPKLDAALLAKAFHGELVPQDPNDEPASGVLECIKTERVSAPKKSRRASRKIILASAEITSVAAFDNSPRSRGKPTMPKSRHDEDVWGKDYLTKLVKQKNGLTTAEELYSRADLGLVDFYHQLAAEHEKGWLKNSDGHVEAA